MIRSELPCYHYCWWFWSMKNPKYSIECIHIYLLRRWHLSLALESFCAPLNNMKYFIPLVLTSLTFIAFFHLSAIQIATWCKAINVWRLIVIPFYLHTLQVDLKNGRFTWKLHHMKRCSFSFLFLLAMLAWTRSK